MYDTVKKAPPGVTLKKDAERALTPPTVLVLQRGSDKAKKSSPGPRNRTPPTPRVKAFASAHSKSTLEDTTSPSAVVPEPVATTEKPEEEAEVPGSKAELEPGSMSGVSGGSSDLDPGWRAGPSDVDVRSAASSNGLEVDV